MKRGTVGRVDGKTDGKRVRIRERMNAEFVVNWGSKRETVKENERTSGIFPSQPAALQRSCRSVCLTTLNHCQVKLLLLSLR